MLSSRSSCESPEARKEPKELSHAPVPAGEEPYFLKVQRKENTSSPIPQLTLHAARFLFVVALGITVIIALISTLLQGVTIDRNISDPIGSSQHADNLVALYQTINGFFWAAFGLVLEEYFHIFLAVMVTFLSNTRWFPSDRPQDGNGKLKRVVIFWFSPLMLYMINIALSSVFIEHKVTGQERGFVDADLVAVSTFSAHNASTMSENSSKCVLDTVLRSAVLDKVVPFALLRDSKCAVSNSAATTSMSVTQLQSTSVAYGFPPQTWNFDALPFALTPTHSMRFTPNFSIDHPEENQVHFRAFQRDSGVNTSVIYDMMVQGVTSFDKAKTDSNAWLYYPCTWVDHLEDDLLPDDDTDSTEDSQADGRRFYHRARRLQGGNSSFVGFNAPQDTFPVFMDEDNWPEMIGLRKCFGLSSALPMLHSKNPEYIDDYMSLWSDTASDVFNISTMSVQLDTFEVSPQMNITAITFDLPYRDGVQYRLGTRGEDTICDDEGHFKDPEKAKKEYPTPVEYAQAERQHCDPSYYTIFGHELCGSRNCVFRDESEVASVKKQLQMTPYVANCDLSNLSYDLDTYSWFPENCTAQDNTIFLYGFGSHITGDFIPKPNESNVLIPNVRRYNTVSFAKINWRFEDVSSRFKAKCQAPNQCDGLLHKLEKASGTLANEKDKARVLVVGKDHLRTPHQNHSMHNPLTLVSVNAPYFYYKPNELGKTEGFTFYTWENIDLKLMNTTYNESDGLGFDKGGCSLLIDSYLEQVNSNHYYIQNPLQAMYTSAIYYLFQDAAVKEIDLPKENKLGVVDLSQPYIGSARMRGDRERKEIKYSIPLVSAVSTSLGMIVLVIYAAVMLKFPRDAVKLTDEANFAAQYADVLIDDQYSRNVHERLLRLPGGEKVEIDDYSVESIEFVNVHEPDITLKL
ncbi:hypothetical protein Poli38472_012405 [Pythium oligandrum]|uniref:Uncharacterized protein n=1 Tax=Pythium oligandrum TaxID=41045 RepID=A0A8K1FNG1_PYTOL|nr:hypothetical protein Poli38472_012405 [Pythium oligandrum]|eukprot:TMW67289.1 hypothetical protein Poli38472_012405 [Pythium oligandrum]